MIRVAQAGSDERYVYNGGKAGDQRKGTPDANGCFVGELNIQPWYNKPWDYLIRPNDAAVAEKMAACAEKIVRNVNIGYDQSQDETLWEAIDKLGWNLSSIDKVPPCETDCCRKIDVCVRMAGILNIPNLKHKWTGNIRTALENSGHFTVIKDKDVVQTTKSLRRGDLLLQEGHHIVIVLDTSTSGGKPYRIANCLACHLRFEGSTKGKHIAYLHPGDVVSLSGWAPTGWGKVTYNGKTGYVSPKYLVEVKRVKATEQVWLRSGAGTGYASIIVIPKGTTLDWDGRTAMNGTTTWYALSYGGYSGFSSGKYIKVVK